ncbi:fimbrial biogenesis chaperone, partial [Escherichia coli]|uniref:fimbrial biogenesis chaperone n=2 Tax=Escherichia coli TaxID=562 RepID=UPI00203B9336
ADRNRSHWSTSKTPSYTKSVSWQHHPISDVKANNVKVNYETIMIAPLESQSVNVKSNNANNWYLTIIDDHGNYISDKI